SRRIGRRRGDRSPPAVPAGSYKPHAEPLEDRITPTNLPPGFTESLVADGFTSPTAMEFAPDGRLFVTEQSGQVRVIKNATLLGQPFLTITNIDPPSESGLIGITFDPDFVHNHYLYVQYTAQTPTIHNRVSRFTADGDQALPGSEYVVLELDPRSSN